MSRKKPYYVRKNTWYILAVVLLLASIAILLSYFRLNQDIRSNAETSCITVTDIKTVPNPPIKNGDSFDCKVTVESSGANSSTIACGLSVNGSWPQNICPSDSKFKGWNGNVATFGCTLPVDLDQKAELKMVGFDFSSSCGPTGDKAKSLVLQEKSTDTSPTPASSPTPTPTINPANCTLPSGCNSICTSQQTCTACQNSSKYICLENIVPPPNSSDECSGKSCTVEGSYCTSCLSPKKQQSCASDAGGALVYRCENGKYVFKYPQCEQRCSPNVPNVPLPPTGNATIDPIAYQNGPDDPCSPLSWAKAILKKISGKMPEEDFKKYLNVCAGWVHIIPGLQINTNPWIPSNDLDCPEIPAGNACSPENLLAPMGPFTSGENAAIAAQICMRESYGLIVGREKRINSGCISGDTPEYSVGLFQINLFAHQNLCPPKTFLNTPSDSKICRLNPEIVNWEDGSSGTRIDRCTDKYLNNAENIKAMFQIFLDAKNWDPWKADLGNCRIP